MDKIQQQLFYRSFELDRATVNKEERSVDLAFSSETPVGRWFGKEILLHGAKNVDLSRLKTMGSALLNHDPSFILGRIMSPRIEDKRGKATLMFDDDEDGNKALAKVESGSLRGVSVGYMVQTFREVQGDEEFNGIKGPAYIATRWTPYEISLTPIPADATVGVGRAMTRSLDGIEIEPLTIRQEDDDMKRDEVLQLIREELPGMISDSITTALADQNRPQFHITPEEHRDLLGKAGAIGVEAKARVAELVDEGRTAVEIINELLTMATDPDARNRGQLGTGRETGRQDGTGNEPRQRITSFKQVEDDDFFRGLTNPNNFVN